jgi:hypothetical protein
MRGHALSFTMLTLWRIVALCNEMKINERPCALFHHADHWRTIALRNEMKREAMRSLSPCWPSEELYVRSSLLCSVLFRWNERPCALFHHFRFFQTFLPPQCLHYLSTSTRPVLPVFNMHYVVKWNERPCAPFHHSDFSVTISAVSISVSAV